MGSEKYPLGTWPIRFRSESNAIWFVLPAQIDLALARNIRFLRINRDAQIPDEELTDRGLRMARRLLKIKAIEAIAICERRHFSPPTDWCVVGIRLAAGNRIDPKSAQGNDFAWNTGLIICRSLYFSDRFRFTGKDTIINCPTCGLCWNQTP